MNNLAISIKDLSKEFYLDNNNSKKALNELCLDVPRGSIFGLLGPNGAGKSTLINILAGMVTKTSGKVYVCGIDIDEDIWSAKFKLGIVPQELILDTFFPVREALEFYAGYYGIRPNNRKTDEIINALGLKDKAKSTSRQLSGGMKRRFLVAKAMVHSPEILVLDEPTAGVDLQLREQLWNYVLELNKNGTTIILTTHYLEEAQRLCDYIAFINNGQIIRSDKKENLMSELSARQATITVNEDMKTLPGYLSQYNSSLIDNNNIRINYKESENIIGEVLYHLHKNNVSIKDIDISQGNLEDIFRKIIK